MMRLVLTLLIFLCSVDNVTAETLDHSAFRTLPVLHEGRIKPLDSFARLHLKQFSGHEKNAAPWLANVLFDQTRATEEKIFLLRDDDLKEQLSLNKDTDFFSFSELQTALGVIEEQIAALIETSPQNLTAEQNRLLKLQSDVITFAELMRSFSLILPLYIDLPLQYKRDFKDRDITYLDLLPLEQKIQSEVKKLVQSKGQDLDKYTADETRLAQLSFNLQLFRLAGENNDLLRVVPDKKTQNWYSPWQLILQGHGSPENKTYLDLWKDMAKAHGDKNAATWMEVTNATFGKIEPRINATKLKLEILYNVIKPFHLALAFYALGFLILIAALSPKTAKLQNAAAFILSAGTITHVVGIGMRMFLLDRPPVGTLYESVIFVSVICALTGLSLFFKNKNLATLFAGIIAATSMLIIAPFLITNSENMEMLVAVLNTNFWLSTHVLCITAGYAISVFAACLAHAYLWLRFKSVQSNTIEKLKSGIYNTSIVALLLTAVGTALGGIWADQSWGRFWGWDPKENGALLIVLWLVWLQHGRLSKKLSELSFAAGVAFLNVIVALAWFGVNLLSVGLHSYGFIDGIAYGLAAFFTLEALIIGLLWWLGHKKGYQHAS